MSELIQKIVEKCGDYRSADGFIFDAKHVANWIDQFPHAQHEGILTCVSNALSVSYFSRQEAEAWLARLLTNEKFSGADPQVFWKKANLLNIQARGRSQREMLVILDAALQASFGFSIRECGEPDGVHIYLDDGLFSGGHINSDLARWIDESAPPTADLRVVTVAGYSYGIWRSMRDIKSNICSSGKSIEPSYWRSLALENGPNRAPVGSRRFLAKVHPGKHPALFRRFYPRTEAENR